MSPYPRIVPNRELLPWLNPHHSGWFSFVYTRQVWPGWFWKLEKVKL
jgi:hypothetical protein